MSEIEKARVENKICCLFEGKKAKQAMKDRELETVNIICDSYRTSRILMRCRKCGGLVLYEYEEPAHFLPGEDWDNAYVEESYYPVLEEDMKIEDGETEFDWKAMSSRKHISASYCELDKGEKPYYYVEAKEPKTQPARKIHTKKSPVEVTIDSLPADEQRVDDLQTFVQLMALDASRSLTVSLPNHDDPQEISIAYKGDSYSMELTFPMEDFGWSHPLVLGGEGLSCEDIRSVLNGVLLEGKSTDKIPAVLESVKDITSQVYGEIENRD